MARTRAKKSGFTLIEVILSLVIFTLLMGAIAMSLQTSFRAQRITEANQEQTGNVRAIFGLLTRDLHAALGAKTNPVSVFQAGGGGTLLTLTSRTAGVIAPGLDAGSEDGSGSSGSTASGAGFVPPQSDIALIQYDFNSAAGELTRSVVSVPNQQSLTGGSPANSNSDPKSALGRRIVSLTLKFWDASSKGWRNVWNFRGQAPAPPAQSGDGQTGNASDPNSGTNPPVSEAATSDTGGDTTLPSAVEIECVVKGNDDRTETYTTRVSITAPLALSPIERASSGAGSGPAASGTASGSGGTLSPGAAGTAGAGTGQ